MDTKTGHTPEISVIIPVFNAEKTLERCVGSILSQSFRDWELILVDDGSTDRSGEMCDSYMAQDGRIKVLHQENKGVSSARNLGLDHAAGKYVAFCDSDDKAGRNWLSCMHEVAEKADLVVCGYNIYRHDLSSDPIPVKETLGTMQMFSTSDRILETLFRARLLQFVWNKLFIRSVIVRSGLRFNESFTIFEDEYFVLGYLAEITDVVCVPECEYNYYLPANFFTKYDFGIDAFQEVVNLIYRIVAEVPGRVRIPSIIYWYKIALGRYASQHTFEETRDRIVFAHKLAASFHDGPFNHILLRILPPRCVYWILKRKKK